MQSEIRIDPWFHQILEIQLRQITVLVFKVRLFTQQAGINQFLAHFIKHFLDLDRVLAGLGILDTGCVRVRIDQVGVNLLLDFLDPGLFLSVTRVLNRVLPETLYLWLKGSIDLLGQDIDSAEFTQGQITLAQVFLHLWQVAERGVPATEPLRLRLKETLDVLRPDIVHDRADLFAHEPWNISGRRINGNGFGRYVGKVLGQDLLDRGLYLFKIIDVLLRLVIILAG